MNKKSNTLKDIQKVFANLPECKGDELDLSTCYANNDFKRLVEGFIDIEDPTEGHEPNFPDDDIDFPDDKTVEPITIEQLTEKDIEGKGVFDQLMYSISNVLRIQYDQKRLEGANYAEVVAQSMASTLQASVSFLLNKDQAYWNSIQAKLAAYKAKYDIITAKYQAYATYINCKTQIAQLQNQKAQYALTKHQIALVGPQYENIKSQWYASSAQYADTLPNGDPINGIIKLDKSLKMAQLEQLNEEIDNARAQTKDKLKDGTDVLGVVGKQKEYYDAQISAYENRSQLDVTSIAAQAWSVQKGVDDGLVAPNTFSNPSIDSMMKEMQKKTGLPVS